MPGGGCPYCNYIIESIGRGRRHCPKCRGAIDVTIKHDPESGANWTTLRAVDDKKRKLLDEQRYDELKRKHRNEKLTRSLKGE